ncbi:polysaccharide biosynthesis/export family protein [Hyphomicrobium sp.]|uniref:polysaccharide biosynthesis/export family protein n=1 Tax=Hyphomicrobium sp. TaxID=82 RepID=UPI002E33F04F|nr:polysaccharide biosynthesis/export family protein [Hyphomicrobium sp.]HEX2842512.1 polysaccharide biosynthesis/export family protein [Hyphomicrobium sp.]
MQLPAYAQSEPYKLGPQDRIRVYVHEWPALTGEVSVGATGVVVLPLIGEVKAEGLVPSALASVVAERLRARAKMAEPPETVVDIVQYRPFYIVGGVDRPGEYNYRPDMMVLNAVTIAGGYYRPERSSDWGMERDVISSLGDRRMALVRREELYARELRARAEASGATEMPEASPDTSDQEKKYVEQERLVFNSRREALTNQVRALEEAIVLAEKEIESLKAQIVAAEVQFESASRELKDTKENVSRGISQATRLLPLERTVAQIDREKKELEAAILRTRQLINQNGRQIKDLSDTRRSTAEAEILTIQTQIKELREREETANHMISGARSEATSERERAANPDSVSVRYFIVRKIDGQPQEIEASETARVLPGDIVKVIRSTSMRSSGLPQSESTIAGSADATSRY